MNGPRNQTALITGASTGIGYELARIFAEKGYDLVLVARNSQKLAQAQKDFEEKFKVSVSALPKDLSRTNAPEEIFRQLQQDRIPVHVLVNNAGFGVHGPFSDTVLADELEMIQVNLVTLTHLTKLFLKGMLAGGEGKILNVASTAAFQPGPLMAIYYATKAYVLSFSEALSEELRGTGVTVTCLCPGPTETEFLKRANVGHTILTTGKLTGRLLDAKTVAEIGYKGLMKKKRVVIPGLMNQTFAFLARYAPRNWVIRAVKFVQTRRR